MGQRFCKAKYEKDAIILNSIKIPLSFITDKIFKDLLSYEEIAKVLTEKVGCIIGTAKIRKILDHYNIKIDSETKAKRNKRRAEKTAENLEAKYGVKNVFQLSETKAKTQQTKATKYGNAFYNNLDKAQQTCLDRYGVSNYSTLSECRNKVIQTNLKKYGTKTPAENPAILDKIKSTCLEKYGTDNYWKSESFKNKQHLEYLQKYPTMTEEYKNICKNPQELAAVITQSDSKTISDLANKFGISRNALYVKLASYNLLGLVDLKPNNTSHFEKELVDYIGKDLCELGNRTILEGKEIDIYIPSKKIGIEFNGTYWHSTAIKSDKAYHYNKSILAAKKGIRLIHIWEYEWTNPRQQKKIKMMLDIALNRVKTKIYARQCEIKLISNKEAQTLNEAIHLQGHRNAQVTYGLFYKNELVQLMSFSKTKYNKNLQDDDSWEIIRGCPGSNNIVVGGVSKLFKHFVLDYAPNQVFSYCDFNKFTGKSYEALGMQFIGYTGPDMKWLLNTGEVVNRSPKKHKELKEKAIAQIFGAGSKKYLWKNNNISY